MSEGIALARSGDYAAARAIFRRVIHLKPDHEDAWLWLAWVAETREQSLRYLQEAEALLPDSQRIQDGVRWAKQQLSGSAIAAEQAHFRAGATPAARQEPQTPSPGQIAISAKKAASGLQQGAARVVEQLREKATPRRTSLSLLRRVRPYVLPTLSLLASVVVLAVAFVAFSSVRTRATRVTAMVLPTPIAEAAPTPAISQRVQPLWVQADVAFTHQDWDSAVAALERIRALDPQNADARKRLAAARQSRANRLVQLNRLEEAGAELDAAIRLDGSGEELQQARRLLAQYLNGVEAYWARDWKRVIENLSVVYRLNAGFRDTAVMLGQAYYEWGMERQRSEIWDEAKDGYVNATKLLPDLADAKKRLAVVEDIILPPKRIEVDLSEQLTYVFEGHQTVKVFKVCTGRGTAPTLPGRYSVLDKMPMAYASKWDLDMPWWIGIYWAGGSENGFHALPILSNGQTLWSGSLGRPCSFGCIVLDTHEAKWLYDWVSVGTVVFVRN
jgi:tetratricopeptide (TPR) repeat protein